MKYSTLKLKHDKNVLTIFLNRPDVHNAMNEKLMTELIDCFKKINEDKKTRIVIITGTGKSFCAGADLNWMKNMVNYSFEENVKDSKLLLDLYNSIYNCKKPVIAKVNGHAFGGGIGLFAACDLAIATSECKFAFSEVKLGIIPSVISTFIVRRIGLSNMKRLFLTGERIDSEYAQKIGLVDFIAIPDKIDEIVNKYITIFNSSGPNAMIQVKDLVNNYEKKTIENYKEHTVKKISELRVSEEGQEGINAFLEKRKSKWS